jgi:hypothetical protein
MFRFIFIAVASLCAVTQLHAQVNTAKQDRPTLAKAYGGLFAFALLCDEMDTKKTGAKKKIFIEHVIVPTARLSEKFAPGGEIRNIVEHPPESMLTEARLRLKNAERWQLKEMRTVCADYERTTKKLAASINSFVDMTQGDLTIPPTFFNLPSAQPNSKNAASEEEDDDGPIPDVFPSRAAFQMRVNTLWAMATACFDPEREKYKSVIELWHNKLTPKIIEKTDADFAKTFARFKGPDDTLYEVNRIKTINPGIAEDCKALEGNIEKMIAAQVP